MMITATNTKGEHIHTWYFYNYANKIQKLINNHWEKNENWYICKLGCAHGGFDKECGCKCHYWNNKKWAKLKRGNKKRN